MPVTELTIDALEVLTFKKHRGSDISSYLLLFPCPISSPFPFLSPRINSSSPPGKRYKLRYDTQPIRRSIGVSPAHDDAMMSLATTVSTSFHMAHIVCANMTSFIKPEVHDV